MASNYSKKEAGKLLAKQPGVVTSSKTPSTDKKNDSNNNQSRFVTILVMSVMIILICVILGSLIATTGFSVVAANTRWTHTTCKADKIHDSLLIGRHIKEEAQYTLVRMLLNDELNWDDIGTYLMRLTLGPDCRRLYGIAVAEVVCTISFEFISAHGSIFPDCSWNGR